MQSLAEPEAEMLPREEVAEMTIEALPGRKQALSGTRNSVRLAVRICTPRAEESQGARPPLHVACVMDCSGSMRGQKLAYAKKAVLKLVKHLTTCDELHFVTYDTDARVVFENGDLSEAGKEALRHQIESVSVGGQTNLCGGLELAASLLSGDHSNTGSRRGLGDSPQKDGAMRRIFLFSDGHVNVGTTDRQVIQRKVSAWADAGVTTGSFGIGADFDEPLMRGIATAGQGRYQFLGTAQDIPKLVSKSIHDLIGIFASEATLDLRGGEFTIVTRVYGGHDEDGDGDGANAPGLLHLGDIHSDNLRMVLADLEVAPPGNAEQGRQFDAVEWVLTCQRNGAPCHFSGQVQLRCTRDRADLGAEAPAVQMAFAVRHATDLEREVAEHLARRDRQQAREVKARQMTLLEKALEAGRSQEAARGGVGRELELLTVVLERARQVAARLEDEAEDDELMARQCWQDRDDFSCASVCDLRDRANSSNSGGSDAGDLDNLSNLSSPRSVQSLHTPSPPSSSSPRREVAGGPLGGLMGMLSRLRPKLRLGQRQART
mmetsp:Transcript_64817/g.189653  ORF Transcript_64817/g.189653 Transcript_64817/m.189653 type:complete len:547 (-) Transcript_64817:2425-4065(-)